MKVIVMFLQRRIENNKQQPIFLTKNNSSYKKLEKAMKEPVKEYDQIKKLVEITDENIIKKKLIWMLQKLLSYCLVKKKKY